MSTLSSQIAATLAAFAQELEDVKTQIFYAEVLLETYALIVENDIARRLNRLAGQMAADNQLIEALYPARPMFIIQNPCGQ